MSPCLAVADRRRALRVNSSETARRLSATAKRGEDYLDSRSPRSISTAISASVSPDPGSFTALIGS